MVTVDKRSRGSSFFKGNRSVFRFICTQPSLLHRGYELFK